MLKEISNVNFMNFQFFLEMAAAGDVPKFPLNFEKDDKIYLYQFPIEYWPEAIKKRFDLLFKALKDLEDSRKKAGIDDLKQRIKKATIDGNWDLVAAWKPKITTGIFKDLTPVPPEKIQEMREGNQKLSANEKKIIADLSATRKAYNHFKSLETGLPNSENETVKMTFNYIDPKVSLRKQAKMGKFGTRSQITFVAKPSLDRLYHRLEKEEGSAHEKYQDILGNVAKYGFDLTDPSVVEKTTKRGEEPKELKLRTAGMIFPNLKIIRDRMQNWLTGVENRIFLPEDEDVENLEWKPARFFNSTFIQDLIDEEVKKLKRLPNWQIKRGETQTDWEMRLKKESEKRIKDLADQGKLEFGAPIPGHEKYGSGRKFEIEQRTKTISAKDKEVFLPFGSQKFPITKIDSNGKTTVEFIQQPVLGPAFYYERKDEKVNRKFATILKQLYKQILEVFDFEPNKPEKNPKKQNLLKEINEIIEKNATLSDFNLQRFLSDVSVLENKYNEFKLEDNLTSKVDIAQIEDQVKQLKLETSAENLRERAVGYKKDLLRVDPKAFKKSEHLAPASLHLTHGLVQRKFLDPSDKKFWDRLDQVLPGYREGSRIQGDPNSGYKYDGPGILVITKEDDTYKAQVFTAARFDVTKQKDYELYMPGQFSILQGMVKCFNSKKSKYCKQIRAQFERKEAVDENVLIDWYEKIVNRFILTLDDEKKLKKSNRVLAAESAMSEFFQQTAVPRRLRAYNLTPQEESERRKMLAQQISPKVTQAQLQSFTPEKKWEIWIDSLTREVVNVLDSENLVPEDSITEKFIENLNNFEDKWKKTNTNTINDDTIDDFFNELNKIVNNFLATKKEKPIDLESALASRSEFNAQVLTKKGLKEIDPYTKQPIWKKLFSTPVLPVTPAKKPVAAKPTADQPVGKTEFPKIRFPERLENGETKLSADFDKFEKQKMTFGDFIKNNISLMISMNLSVLRNFVLSKLYQIADLRYRKVLADTYSAIDFLKSIDLVNASAEQIKTFIEKSENFSDPKKFLIPPALSKMISNKIEEQLEKVFFIGTPKQKLSEIYRILLPTGLYRDFLNRKKAELKF